MSDPQSVPQQPSTAAQQQRSRTVWGSEIGPMFVGLSTLRNGEASLRWTRAQFFLFANSSGVAVIPTLWLNEQYNPAFLVVLALAGFALSVTWMQVNKRAKRWIDYWNDRLKAVEAEAQVKAFSHPDFDKREAEEPSYNTILFCLSGFFIVFWSIALVVTIARIVR